MMGRMNRRTLDRISTAVHYDVAVTQGRITAWAAKPTKMRTVTFTIKKGRSIRVVFLGFVAVACGPNWGYKGKGDGFS